MSKYTIFFLSLCNVILNKLNKSFNFFQTQFLRVNYVRWVGSYLRNKIISKEISSSPELNRICYRSAVQHSSSNLALLPRLHKLRADEQKRLPSSFYIREYQPVTSAAPSTSPDINIKTASSGESSTIFCGVYIISSCWVLLYWGWLNYSIELRSDLCIYIN